jgi:hypothetical protein
MIKLDKTGHWMYKLSFEGLTEAFAEGFDMGGKWQQVFGEKKMIDKDAPISEHLGADRHQSWEDKRTAEIEQLKAELAQANECIELQKEDLHDKEKSFRELALRGDIWKKACELAVAHEIDVRDCNASDIPDADEHYEQAKQMPEKKG